MYTVDLAESRRFEGNKPTMPTLRAAMLRQIPILSRTILGIFRDAGRFHCIAAGRIAHATHGDALRLAAHASRRVSTRHARVRTPHQPGGPVRHSGLQSPLA